MNAFEVSSLICVPERIKSFESLEELFLMQNSQIKFSL